MFSMTKSRELDEAQSQDADGNKRHFGEDVKFYRYLVSSNVIIVDELKFYMFTRMHLYINRYGSCILIVFGYRYGTCLTFG